MRTDDQAEVLRTLLTNVQREVSTVEGRLADLHAEQHGLTLALARLTGSGGGEAVSADTGKRTTVEPEVGGASEPDVHGTQPPDVHEVRTLTEAETWPLLSKTDQVRRVLREATEPMSATDVMKRLGEVGLPQNDTESVRGSLAYLKRKGIATFRGRSNWVLIGGAVDQRLTDSNAPSSGNSVAPEPPDGEVTPTTGSGGDDQHDPQHHDHGDSLAGRHPYRDDHDPPVAGAVR